MKKWNVYEIAFILLVILFFYILGIVITAMVISKIPTTPENKEIREQIIELVSGIQSTINLVIGFKLGKYVNEKNENK